MVNDSQSNTYIVFAGTLNFFSSYSWNSFSWKRVARRKKKTKELKRWLDIFNNWSNERRLEKTADMLLIFNVCLRHSFMLLCYILSSGQCRECLNSHKTNKIQITWVNDWKKETFAYSIMSKKVNYGLSFSSIQNSMLPKFISHVCILKHRKHFQYMETQIMFWVRF